MSSVFDVWEATLAVLQSAQYPSSGDVPVEVYFGWPSREIAADSVVLGAEKTPQASEQTRSTFCSDEERYTLSVFATTRNARHASAFDAARALKALERAVREAIGATKRPPDLPPDVKVHSWNISGSEEFVVPDANGWIAQARIYVEVHAVPRSSQ